MGELQTTRGQETGDETNSEQTRHGATEAVTRTTNSKGSEYGAGAMNCSRPGVVNSSASHALDPGELASMSMAATEDMRFNAWEWLWPLCKKTLPDAIVGAHPSTVPGALPLQAVHSSKSARLCLTRTGLRTRQPKGSRTTCSLGFEHTPAAGNLRTITGTHPRLGAKTQLSTL